MLPRSLDRGHAEYFAGANLEVDIAHASAIRDHVDPDSGCDESIDRTSDLSRLAGRRFFSEKCNRELVSGEPACRALEYDAPAPQHSYVVGNAQRLMQLVRDEHNGIPIIRKT